MSLLAQHQAIKVAGSQRVATLLQGSPEVRIANEAFELVLERSKHLSTLLANFESAQAQYCIFGGWLRDSLANRIQASPLPRDVDIVVANVDKATLIAMMPEDVKPTIFGGVQNPAPPVPFDIWPLHETFLIRALELPSSFESLLKTTDFNINAAIYFPAQGMQLPIIIDAGMLSALDCKQIAFNASNLPFPVLQCTRLAAYGAKLGFSFAPSVIRFMRTILRNRIHRGEVVTGLKRYLDGPIAEKAIAIVTSIADGRT